MPGRSRRRDMTGTARCTTCKDIARHQGGPGTPLVIRHETWCPEFFPTKAAITGTDVAERIEVLAARWHRACPEPGTVGVNDFTAGRMAGYTQAISLLLGTHHSNVKKALEEGTL